MTDDARGGWRTAAACAGLGPSVFYDSTPIAIARAKSFCAGCPVRSECGAHAAVVGEFGVWGGLTETERAARDAARRGPPPAVDDAELVALLASGDTTVRAATLLRRRGDLSRRTIYKYLSRARVLGLVERRDGHLYPVGR